MVKKQATKWRTVQIPEDCYKKVKEFVEGEGSGYASISEYVRAALRGKLEDAK